MSSKLRPFPNYRSEDKDAYQEMFKELAKEFGREKAEKGIVAALNDSKRPSREFIPAPTIFREYVESASVGVVYGAPKPGCQFCGGYGWATHPRQPGRVTKCECRRIA